MKNGRIRSHSSKKSGLRRTLKKPENTPNSKKNHEVEISTLGVAQAARRKPHYEYGILTREMLKLMRIVSILGTVSLGAW